MSDVSGDYRALSALSFAIAGLPDKGKKALLASAARELLPLVQGGFTLGMAPDESRWAPVKRRGGQPLVKTGALMGSFTSEVHDDEARVGTNTFYATYHQTGTSRMVARPMVPSAGTLPPAWANVLGQALDKALSEAFRASFG